MNYLKKISVACAVMIALSPLSGAFAQVEGEARVEVSSPDLQAETAPPEATTETAPDATSVPTVPGLTTETAVPVPTAQIQTQSAEAFLQSLATKFGTSVKRLKGLLAKLPPRGKGLNGLEISVIAGKLKLSKAEKEVMKAKIGNNGTGFNNVDVQEMGTRLGLTPTEVARLSQELGIAMPAIATPTAQPAM
jgi:LysM repeat protein